MSDDNRYCECSYCLAEIYEGDKYYYDSVKGDYYCTDCAQKFLESQVADEKQLLDDHAYGQFTEDDEPIIEGETYYHEEWWWFYKDPAKFLESAVRIMDKETLDFLEKGF